MSHWKNPIANLGIIKAGTPMKVVFEGKPELPKIENSYAIQLKEKLTNIQYKLEEDTFGWTVKV